MHLLDPRMAYGRGIITQTYYTVNGNGRSAAFYVIWLVLGIGLAFIPAAIASHKGRSFGLFFLFGLFCFLPALIVSLVINDPRAAPPFGAAGYGNWNPQPGGWVPPGSPAWGSAPAPPPPTPNVPAGWYPDPAGSAQQRYWDGTAWTEHLH